MEISDNQNQAASDLFDFLVKRVGKRQRVHPATVISTAARLAGSFMFRSFEFDLKDAEPGTPVLSEEANVKGPELLNIISWVLHNLGVKPDNEDIEKTKPEKSDLEFLEALSLVQLEARDIMNKWELNEEQMAQACAMTTGAFIEQCKNDLAVESGFNTAIYALIEGTKTVPPEFEDQVKRDRPWYRFW